MFLPQGLLVAALAVLAAAANGLRSSPSDEAGTAIPDRYIIELTPDADYDAVVKEISSKPGVTVHKELRSPVFTGLSVQASQSSPELFSDMPQVAQAWRSQSVKLLPAADVSVLKDGVDAANYSVHSMTGVDKVHASGVYGKGVKVAIVDTGVDYNHPVLGGGFGPGFKVGGGYDLVGDTTWPDGPKAPDSDPMDQIGRGTHAAGIVAGKGDWYTGVAPEATILAYKVFTATDYTDDETLMEAFIKAYEDGADVISATFGSTGGWSTGALATVASRLVNEGVVVIVGAGNSGSQGPFYLSNGGTGENVLSVASADPTIVTGLPVLATMIENGTNETKTIAYRPGNIAFQTSVRDGSVLPLSLDPEVADDACNPLPDTTPDLRDKIVLVRISLNCTDRHQVDMLMPHNPFAILFYHNEGKNFFNPFNSFYQGPMGIITPEAGKWMVETIAKGGNITLDFSESNSYYVDIPAYNSGGAASPFTSWGATFDLQLKPDVSAPGANIYGPWLTSNSKPWMTVGGTFSAAHYVAGVAALYISKHGGRALHGRDFGKMLHARITSSAAAMTWQGIMVGGTPDDKNYLAPVLQVGTGVVDAVKIMNYTTQLSFERFNLNDTRYFSRYHGVDITNNGDKELVYTFEVQDSGSFDAFETNSSVLSWAPNMNGNYDVKMYKMAPEVRFPAGTFRVKPGETRKAEFIFKMPELPEGHIGADMPIISGKILIMSSNGEQLGVPYFGMVGDLKNSMRETGMFGRISSQFPRGPDIITQRGLDVAAQRIADKPYWGFNLTSQNADYPFLTINLAYGAREMRWDIYEPVWRERKWQYPPKVGENGFIGSVSYWRNSDLLARDGRIFDDDDVDDVVPTPAEYIHRNYPTYFAWFGHLNNGSMIAPGNYTMRLAVLLPFGNREASDNWDVAELPEVMITGLGK